MKRLKQPLGGGFVYTWHQYIGFIVSLGRGRSDFKVKVGGKSIIFGNSELCYFNSLKVDNCSQAPATKLKVKVNLIILFHLVPFEAKLYYLHLIFCKFGHFIFYLIRITMMNYLGQPCNWGHWVPLIISRFCDYSWFDA